MYEVNIQLPLKLKESSNQKIITPEQCSEYCDDLRALAQEAVQVLTLDIKNNVIDRHLTFLGSLNSCIVRPREVFRVAIMDNASGIILVHNHPSGDPTPSSDDIRVTKQLVSAGDILGIKVVDHVVIGSKSKRDSFISLRESGLCRF